MREMCDWEWAKKAMLSFCDETMSKCNCMYTSGTSLIIMVAHGTGQHLVIHDLFTLFLHCRVTERLW